MRCKSKRKEGARKKGEGGRRSRVEEEGGRWKEEQVTEVFETDAAARLATLVATSFDVHVLDFTINDAAMILADKAAQHVASMATPRSQTDVETLLLEKGFGALVAELPVAVRTDVRKVAILGATCALALYHVKSYNPNNPAKVSGTSTHPGKKGKREKSPFLAPIQAHTPPKKRLPPIPFPRNSFS